VEDLVGYLNHWHLSWLMQWSGEKMELTGATEGIRWAIDRGNGRCGGTGRGWGSMLPGPHTRYTRV
jgi:hypothetical protein